MIRSPRFTPLNCHATPPSEYFFGAHFAALNFSAAAAPSLWNLKPYDRESRVLLSTSPLTFYVVFNIVRRPLDKKKLSLSAVFSFPEERNLKPEKERQESGRPLTSRSKTNGRSLGSSLKRFVSHSSALSSKEKKSPGGRDTIRRFNFLEWIKALHTCQAIVSSIWTHLSPNADLCS